MKVMSEVVSVEVALAIVVDGQVVLPGRVVEVLPGDARILVAQGRAKWLYGPAGLPRDTDLAETGEGEGKERAQMVGKAKRKGGRDLCHLSV